MSSYVASIWKCRYFWASLVQMDLRNRYRRSILGLGWSLLHPIAMTAVLCSVFSRVFGQDPFEYAPSLLVGLCFWNFITSSTKDGCQSLFQGEKYIRQYPAPMAIYPLRTVLGASFHFLVALAVVLVLRFSFKGFDGWVTLASLGPALVLLLILGWSLAVLAGFSTAYFPDVLHLSEVGLQILFYATPIIYPADVLRNKGLGWIVDYNPLASFVQMLRQPLLHGQWPDLNTVGMAVLATSCMAAAAVFTLVRNEKQIIFQL
ncbi:MAG: ABC transporter permease [Planctomycetales bacterium]